VAAEQAGGFVAIRDAQLAAGAIAIGVDGRLRHAELARDLLRAEVLVHQAQTFALALRQQLDRLRNGVWSHRHAKPVKGAFRVPSTLTRGLTLFALFCLARGAGLTSR
jgi:hypothetical protein